MGAYRLARARRIRGCTRTRVYADAGVRGRGCTRTLVNFYPYSQSQAKAVVKLIFSHIGEKSGYIA